MGRPQPIPKRKRGTILKILNVIAQKPDFTGSGIFLARTVEQELLLGHETAVICGIENNETIETLPDRTEVAPVRFSTDEVPFNVCGMSDTMPYPSTRYRDLEPDAAAAFEAAFSRRLTETLESFDPDIVVCHHLYLLTSIVRETVTDRPVVAFCHSTDLRQMEQHDLQRDRIIQAVRDLDRIFALHAQQQADIERIYGVDPQRISQTGPGFDQDAFNLDGPPVHRAQGSLVFVGKVSRAKGVQALVEALNLISADRVPEGFSLDLVGGHGSDRAEYETLCECARTCAWPVALRGRVPLDELVAKYRSSEVFVLPSFFDGLPLSAVEALACGCKAVLSDLPGLRPWFEKNIPDAPIVWVAPPRMKAVDEPIEEDLPAFERRLADAVVECLAMPSRPACVNSLSWKSLTERFVREAAEPRLC